MSLSHVEHYCSAGIQSIESIALPRIRILKAIPTQLMKRVGRVAIDSIDDIADYAAKALRLVLPKRIFSVFSRYTVQIPHCINPDDYHYWDQITRYTYVGAMPLDNYHHAETVRDLGVRAILAIAEDHELLYAPWSDPVKASNWKKHKIDVLQISSADLEPLSILAIAQAVDYIAAHVQRKHKVYVHCNAGRGRSIMVMASYLCSKLGLEIDEALEHIKKQRKQAIPSDEQKEAIQAYLDSLNPK